MDLSMDLNNFFEMTLSISKPWYIKNIEFDPELKKIDFYIDFEKGALFSSRNSDCTDSYKAYDTKNKSWRHLNLFEHECYLHCRTPRIKTELGIELISPPWDGISPSFTLLFEAFIIELCTKMPVKAVAGTINETDGKIWRMLKKYIEAARLNEDFSKIDSVGMDETSRAKKHKYITLFVDMEEKRTIYVTEGKGHETVKNFSKDLKDHNGLTENILNVSCDMSPAFIKGVEETLPNAKITYDKFHIVKLINDAVDAVRREEVGLQPLLKKTRYIFLKNQKNLTDKEKEKLKEISLPKLNLKTVRALTIRESFQKIYESQTEEEFIFLLQKWYFWATHSRLEPIIKVAKTIKNHWDGIVEWKRSQINNGILEGLNSVVQAAKSKARGFRTAEYFKITVYLITGQLNFEKVNIYCK